MTLSRKSIQDLLEEIEACRANAYKWQYLHPASGATWWAVRCLFVDDAALWIDVMNMVEDWCRCYLGRSE